MVSAPNGPVVDTAGCGCIDRRLDDLDLLAAEQPAFTGMGIEAAHGNLGRAGSQSLERAVGSNDHTADPLARDHVDGLSHALVQRGMDDLRVAEAQHQVDVVLGRSGLPRHEGRMAVELDACERDGGLVLRRRDHGIDLAGERGLDGAAGKSERGAPARGVSDAEGKRGRLGLLAIEHVQRST